jgi:hypothetical protein
LKGECFLSVHPSRRFAFLLLSRAYRWTFVWAGIVWRVSLSNPILNCPSLIYLSFRLVRRSHPFAFHFPFARFQRDLCHSSALPRPSDSSQVLIGLGWTIETGSRLPRVASHAAGPSQAWYLNLARRFRGLEVGHLQVVRRYHRFVFLLPLSCSARDVLHTAHTYRRYHSKPIPDCHALKTMYFGIVHPCHHFAFAALPGHSASDGHLPVTY